MIGYSSHAKTRYHKTYQSQWAKCTEFLWLTFCYPDDQEAKLKKSAPDLSRCTRCWKGEK